MMVTFKTEQQKKHMTFKIEHYTDHMYIFIAFRFQ